MNRKEHGGKYAKNAEQFPQIINFALFLANFAVKKFASIFKYRIYE